MIQFWINFYLLFKFVILKDFGKFMLNFGYLGFGYILLDGFHYPFYFYVKFADVGFGGCYLPFY